MLMLTISTGLGRTPISAIDHRFRNRKRMISALRNAATTVGSLASLFLIGGCADSSTVGPGADQPAQLVISASFQSVPGPGETVQITSAYLLKNGSYSPLSTQSITLSGTTQSVPVGIDLANCLADTQRSGIDGTPVASDECVVRIEVQLLINSAQVDRQFIGPISLRPGSVTTIAGTIQLNDIGDVRVTAPSVNVVGAGLPLRVEIGGTMSLAVAILDRQQQPIAGRSATWTSSNPAVATVSVSGVVTPLAVGTAVINADVGGHLRAVEIRVVPPPATLTVTRAGSTGSGLVSSLPAGINCVVTGTSTSGVCSHTFPGDIDITLTATPTDGSGLVGWTGDCIGSGGRSCTVSMNSPRSVGATFRDYFTLNVGVTGSGSGIVNSTPVGIACRSLQGSASGTCASPFFEGTIVSLVALPGEGSIFAGWSGDCAGVTSLICEVTMKAARNVTALFGTPVPVIIVATGTGTGTVSSLPTGISCAFNGAVGSGECSHLFATGTIITLAAVATDSNIFNGWIGCTSTSGTTCTVRVPAQGITIGVQFDAFASLSVVPSGSGGGLVRADTTINCVRSAAQNSGSCSGSMRAGSTITLSAVPDEQSEFGGWTGACSGRDTCVVAMNQTRTVGAVFNRLQVQLMLTLNGAGFGSVRVSSGQVCTLGQGESQKTCNIPLPMGSIVTLEAEPGLRQVFAGFSGNCNSGSTSCTLVLSRAMTVAALFNPPTVMVSVGPLRTATGGGTVTSGELPINCLLIGPTTSQGSCVASAFLPTLPNGVTLRATPNPTSTFGGWAGACASAGLATICRLADPQESNSVYALFTAIPTVLVKVYLTGYSAGSVSALGNGWSRTCSYAPIPGGSAILTTLCNWQIPVALPFQVNLSGTGVWTSTVGQLCYHANYPCLVPGGITRSDSLSAYFESFGYLMK